MTDEEFIVLNVGLLKEILEDIPDEYVVRFEDRGLSYPIMDYDISSDFQELTLKPGDIE